MSRRRKGRRSNEQDGCMPKPPHRRVFRQYPYPHYEEVPTELHRALTSLGQDDKTSKLSDYEFNSQLAEEMGYMMHKSCVHIGRSIGMLIRLFKNIL